MAGDSLEVFSPLLKGGQIRRCLLALCQVMPGRPQKMKTYEGGQDVGAQVDVHDFSWLVQNAQ